MKTTIIIFAEIISSNGSLGRNMNVEVDPTAYRRLSGSNASPGFRRTKSVRASFRMLGARWKPVSQKNDVLIKKDRTKDIVLERFGKELNDSLKNRMQNESFLKSSTAKLFNSFATKENIPAKSQFYDNIPMNVAPKAAALLQIPLMNQEHDRVNNKKLDRSFRIDPQAGDLIANTQQFNDFRKCAMDEGNGEKARLATVRRAPYWTSNVLYSKKIQEFEHSTMLI